MRAGRWWGRGPHALGVAALALASGCGSTPPSRFYALAPAPRAEAGAPAAEAAFPEHFALGLRLASLPEEVDRPQMLFTLDPHRRELDEFSRWVAPLRQHLALVLRRNLELRLGEGRVFDATGLSRPDLDRRVHVEILAFDAELDGPCTLEARFHVLGRTGNWITSRSFRHSTTASTEGAAGVAEAMSANLTRLADEVAQALREQVAETAPAASGV